MAAKAPVERAPVVKQGWLKKKAEHFRDWRPRYFILREDGSFLGYRKEPYTEADLDNVLNNFTVKNSEIILTDRPKNNAFSIRGLHYTTIVERTFCADNKEERSSWVNAIENVKIRLEDGEGVVDGDDAGPFGQQGQKTHTSGSIKVTFDNFEFLKVLGKGNFGKVILCREKATNQLYAMKVLNKGLVIRKGEMEHTKTELRVLKTTSHPFLLTLRYSFTTAERLCLVTEYVNGGDIYFHLAKDKQFSEDRARFYGAEIVSAIEYLHKQSIIYRDLKLENILLDHDGHIKIADFGMCKEDMCNGRTTNTICGTPEYLAPEIISEHDYGHPVDWWGLGIVLYEMMVGIHPFINRNQDQMYENIVDEEVKFPANADLSDHATSLLLGLLEKDPAQRLGGGPADALDIKNHPFFANYIDWQLLFDKKLTPPFKPRVTSDTDTQYFDIEFTQESVELTPPDPADLSATARIDEVDESFLSFSYTNGSDSVLEPDSRGGAAAGP